MALIWEGRDLAVDVRTRRSWCVFGGEVGIGVAI